MKNIIKETRKYWDNGYNCSQSTARGILDTYGYKKQSKVLGKALIPFGGGIGERSVCGAVTGSLAALSIILVKKNIEDEKKSEMFRKFKDLFIEKNGALYCKEILRDFILPDGTLDKDHPARRPKCDHAIDTAVLIVDDLIKNSKN